MDIAIGERVWLLCGVSFKGLGLGLGLGLGFQPGSKAIAVLLMSLRQQMADLLRGGVHLFDDGSVSSGSKSEGNQTA